MTNDWSPYLIKAMRSIMKHWGTWDEGMDHEANLAFFNLEKEDKLNQIYFLSLTDRGADGIIKVDLGDYPTKITTYLENGIEYYVLVDALTQVVKEA